MRIFNLAADAQIGIEQRQRNGITRRSRRNDSHHAILVNKTHFREHSVPIPFIDSDIIIFTSNTVIDDTSNNHIRRITGNSRHRDTRQ